MKLANFEEDVEPLEEFHREYPDRPAMLKNWINSAKNWIKAGEQNGSFLNQVGISIRKTEYPTDELSQIL